MQIGILVQVCFLPKGINGNFKGEIELQELILNEKVRGTSDFEIGQKYGVTYSKMTGFVYVG